MTAPSPRFGAAGLEIRDWGGSLAVVYSHRSNSTHLVTAGAAELLRLAAAGQLSTELLAEHAEAVEMLSRFGLIVEHP